MRAFGRKLALAGLLLAALAAAAYLGPLVARAMRPDHLATVDELIDRLWWPATGVRLAVYALLAWGLYPVWVRERARAPAGEDPAADAGRQRLDARLAHLARAARRRQPVFWMLLASDLAIAQLPYWLLRG